MIEGAILLHQDDDMTHILDGARAAMGRNFECAGDTGGKSRSGRSAAQGLQESAAVGGHGILREALRPSRRGGMVRVLLSMLKIEGEGALRRDG
jgi:hypothetical protein